MKRIFLLFLGLVILAACENDIDVSGGDGGSTASASSSNSSGSSNSSSSSGGMAVDCVGNPPSFPTFDKSCVTPADCIIGLHMVNCCGTRTAIGINAAEASAFSDAETTCEMQYPGCGCAQAPTTTEDGKMSIDETSIQVDCMNGQCMTFLP